MTVEERALELALEAIDSAAHILNNSNDDALFEKSMGERVQELEQDMIKKALRRTGGNKTQAAALLGINRQTLNYKASKMAGPKILWWEDTK